MAIRGRQSFSARIMIPPVHQRQNLDSLIQFCPVQGEVPSTFAPGRANTIIKAQLWDLEGDGLVSTGSLQAVIKANKLWIPDLWATLHLARIFHFLWEAQQLSGGQPVRFPADEPSVILRHHQAVTQHDELRRVIDRERGVLGNRRFYVPSSTGRDALEVVYAQARWYIRAVSDQEARQLQMRRFLALKPTRS